MSDPESDSRISSRWEEEPPDAVLWLSRKLFYRDIDDRNKIDLPLPQGSLNTDLIELRVNLALNTRLFLNGLIQYNSETNDFITNFWLDFIHSPGSDLFLVFNEAAAAKAGTSLTVYRRVTKN